MKGTELMDRIRDEMNAADNDYIDTMGDLLTEYLRMHPDAEVDGKKSLKGAFDALRSQAQKKQKGGCYAMPPREVFGGMMEYFELPHTPADYSACMAAVIGQSAPDAPAPAVEAPKTENLNDLLDLDALLEG